MKAVTVKCHRGDGNVTAPDINDALIVTESMAVTRGKRFLDDPNQGGYYSAVKRRLKVPHKSPDVVPGSWITVTDSKLGLLDTALKVLAVSVTITKSSVWAEVEAESYE